MLRLSVPPLTNPDDNCPSSSRFITNFHTPGGPEFVLEVRSAYDGTATFRMGEITLWRGPDVITIRTTSEEDG